ncbi:MAG TPA: hypothetical protein DDW89_08025, partial [Gammaproteobacteria bacterium]|nr:hypothetical protein [Gammaproteobacteria bacterium]
MPQRAIGLAPYNHQMNPHQSLRGQTHVPANNLHRLVLLRGTAHFGLAAVVVVAHWLLGLAVPLGLPLIILGVMVIDNASAWRLTQHI